MGHIYVLCGVISLLSLNLKTIIFMKTTAEIKKIAYSICNSCNEIGFNQVLEGLNTGIELCQKEYEEKLRWIPIEEKVPEYTTIKKNNRVEIKFINIHGEEQICAADFCQIPQHLGENSPMIDVWYAFSSCVPLKNVISWRSIL